MLTVIPGFVPPHECVHLIDLFDANRNIRGSRQFQPESQEIPGSLLAHDRTLSMVRGSMADHLRTMYGENVYPEFTVMSELRTGGRHSVHADNVTCVADQWVPNHTPQRSHTALVYLNGDFEGGAIEHHFVGTTLRPRIGTLISFPCHGHYQHEVHPVTAGRRMSIALWATQHPRHVEGWPQ